jgi:hypothetical protein
MKTINPIVSVLDQSFSINVGLVPVPQLYSDVVAAVRLQGNTLS